MNSTREKQSAGLWVVCVALALIWVALSRQRATVAAQRIDLEHQLASRSATSFVATSAPVTAPILRESTPLDAATAERLRRRARDVHRLRNQLTQLRQQQRALGEAWKKVQSAQVAMDPILDENRRIQIEIARLEEIQRNLRPSATHDPE